MPDPRMIPADEARETLREVQEPKVNLAWSNAWVGDLAHTVVEQAAQIERVREAMADIEAEIDRRRSTPYVNPAETTLGMSLAARMIRTAIGDTDE